MVLCYESALSIKQADTPGLLPQAPCHRRGGMRHVIIVWAAEKCEAAGDGCIFFGWPFQHASGHLRNAREATIEFNEVELCLLLCQAFRCSQYRIHCG